MSLLADIDPHRPVLIAGPTASGKSALAMMIARAQGGVVVNADALQVYENWRILSARPSVEDEAAQPHRLFGHIGPLAEYSVGHWLREVTPLLHSPHRPIIVGGTGLYFTALTEGLADIPATPPGIRSEADHLLKTAGLTVMLDALDPATADRIDRLNPMRVQRAWEVQRATGRGLAAWQDDTPPPVLPLDACTPLLVEAGREWLSERIAHRFDAMLAAGALDEARSNLPLWDPARPSMKAIGAPELIAHLNGEITLKTAREAATIATRQYAKRQRTWFRARMKKWRTVAAETLSG
ncbi:tRNA (adenosine(37)-N6)-dimethylallyltransferase MiaA [uncultured Roseovarius sp.]|uniref:tRNA (adenosine(37)-N6)-dimethylallyltransferase MiaA n=1 Tax=uncultured Roseovarius sp. TaxID=293344 RepID=UPI0026276BD4|nr:tRNA (adenosine(37)-N6)-dimethylallyltransferase MiaA [uncultured Roseovarius sp.]